MHVATQVSPNSAAGPVTWLLLADVLDQKAKGGEAAEVGRVCRMIEDQSDAVGENNARLERQMSFASGPVSLLDQYGDAAGLTAVTSFTPKCTGLIPEPGVSPGG